jgi:hypothetical protein
MLHRHFPDYLVDVVLARFYKLIDCDPFFAHTFEAARKFL